MPERIQLRRIRGWRLPPNTARVDRSTRWGNPCRVGMFKDYTAADAVRDFELWIARDLSVRSFENAFGEPPSIEEIVAHLHGKNLACWCKPGEPCHADVLLRIANTELDECSRCNGVRGGVKGNENVVDGVVLCDYCHADDLKRQ
jgi:hypothetical protein